MTVTATLFLVVAIMHLLRIIFGWQVEIGGLSIPFWVSWLAVPVDDALAYFRLHGRTGSPRGRPTCRDEPLNHGLAFGRCI